MRSSYGSSPSSSGSRPHQDARPPSTPVDVEFDAECWSSLMLATPNSTQETFLTIPQDDTASYHSSHHHNISLDDLYVFEPGSLEDASGHTYDTAMNTLSGGTLFSPGDISSDIDHRLAILRINVAKGFQTTASPETSSLESLPGFFWDARSGESDMGQRMGLLDFAGALQKISNFLRIIEQYKQEAHEKEDRHDDSEISIVTLTDILFTYRGLVSMYDELSTQLYAQLLASTGEPLPSFQVLPGLQLAGLPVEHGCLQTKILLQAIVHHFEMIERSIGLPRGYRVSSRQEDYSQGLLEGQRGDQLLDILMGNGCERTALTSLRDNLERIKQLINV